MCTYIRLSSASKKQWSNCQSDKHEPEWRQQRRIGIIQNAQSSAESYDGSHDEPKETPLPAPPITQNAILDRFQQAEARKNTVNDECFARRDTTEDLLELMVSRTPPVDNMRGREAKAEEGQTKIDDHGPLAQRECASREAQGTSDTGDDAETERKHDGQDHEGNGDLPEQRIMEVSGEDLDSIHAKVRGHESDWHVNSDEETYYSSDLVLLQFFQGFSLVSCVSLMTERIRKCFTCC